MKSKLALSLIALTAALQAEVSTEHLQNQINMLQKEVNDLKQKPACGMLNPADRPKVRDGIDLFVTGDYLFWKVQQDGVPYVIVDKLINSALTPTIQNGKVHDFRGKWASGFRIGAGYNTPHDGWDIYATWMYLHTRSHTHKSLRSSATALYPTLFSETLYNPFVSRVSSADARWRLRLDLFDLEIAREYFVSKWVTLRPFFGLRGGWINQRFNTTYQGTTPGQEPLPTDGFMRMKNNFNGIGLRVGLNTAFGFYKGLSLYADAALSALYGRFHTNARGFVENIPSAPNNFIRSKHSFTSARPILDLAAGFRYEQMCGDDRVLLTFQAGWEEHVFWGQNQVMRFFSDDSPGLYFSNQGDLTTSGLVISARIDF